jgi:hypothetical protein
LRVLQMSVKEITPEFLMEFKLKNAITDILEQYSPWLRRILLTAAQTLRSANKNTIKKVEQVRSYGTFNLKRPRRLNTTYSEICL